MANGDGVFTLSFTGTNTDGEALPTMSVTQTVTGLIRAEKNTNISVGTASAVALATVAAAATGSAFTSLKGVIIYNKSTANFIRVRRKDDSAHAVDEKILPGGFAYFGNGRELSVSETSGTFSAFSNLDTIELQADTAACKVEVLIVG